MVVDYRWPTRADLQHHGTGAEQSDLAGPTPGLTIPRDASPGTALLLPSRAPLVQDPTAAAESAADPPRGYSRAAHYETPCCIIDDCWASGNAGGSPASATPFHTFRSKKRYQVIPVGDAFDRLGGVGGGDAKLGTGPVPPVPAARASFPPRAFHSHGLRDNPARGQPPPPPGRKGNPLSKTFRLPPMRDSHERGPSLCGTPAPPGLLPAGGAPWGDVARPVSSPSGFGRFGPDQRPPLLEPGTPCRPSMGSFHRKFTAYHERRSREEELEAGRRRLREQRRTERLIQQQQQQQQLYTRGPRRSFGNAGDPSCGEGSMRPSGRDPGEGCEPGVRPGYGVAEGSFAPGEADSKTRRRRRRGRPRFVDACGSGDVIDSEGEAESGGEGGATELIPEREKEILTDIFKNLDSRGRGEVRLDEAVFHMTENAQVKGVAAS